MNRIALLTMLTASLAGFACSNGPADSLSGGESYDPNSLAAGQNTQHHFQDPGTADNGVADPNLIKHDEQAVGSPEVVARLHSCSKITYAGLGSILASRGVNIKSTTGGSAGAIYSQGRSALGVANYAGRVPEALIGSTAAVSKQFDIFVAAAGEVLAGAGMSSGCQGVKLVDASTKFTLDGLSCIMGKPATDEHVFIANQAVLEAQTQGLTLLDGQKIAIASLLEAAHTCE